MAENIFSLGQLEDKLIENGLGEMLSGEYLEKNVSKQFAAEDKRTLNAAVEMAKRGVKHSLSLGLARVEKAAKDKGFSVGFSFNEKTNEVDVILYEGKTQQEINAQSKKEFLNFKAEMPHFRLAIGTPTKGTKYRMPSTKALAAHIDNEGAYFATELEDILEGVADKISSSKRYKGQSGENFKRRMKSAVRRGKESAVKSIISTEAYSIVDDEKYYEELRHQQSAARDTFLQTDVKTAGILGEVAKKLDLTRTIKKARNLTNKQVESYNRRIDNLLTKYQITYQTLGKQAAENLMKNADIWSELMIEEKQVDKILSDTEKYFGSFLQMRGQIGLSSDEAMQRKTMSFAGQRDVALRGKVETNRHPSQARNYLRRKDQTVRRRTEMVIPAAMKDEMDYFSGSDKQLYKKALVTSEADVYDAYIGAIDDAIKEELKKLRRQKANKWVSEEELQKMAEERVRKNLPVIAPSVLDDMGIISASAAKSLDSVRTVAKNITSDEYNKLNAEATKKWQKLIDSGKTPKMPQDEYISNYIAKKATGRSKLSDVSINIGENGGVDISALEDVKFGGQTKTLDYNENLRETKQVLPDNIVKFMAQRLGISGAVDMIGRAKSVKASEIPQYVQMILTTWAIENGLDANGINQLAINILGKAVVQGVTEDGKLIIDNARDLWENYDWDSALSRMAEMGMIHKTTSGYSLGKAGDKAFSLYDVVNVADVWNSTKDVKTSYKESSGVFRDIQSMSTRAQSEGEKKAFNELSKEVKAMYDPMTGSGTDEAKKAKEDIDKILNEKTGSIVKTYESKKDEDREKSVRRLKKEHYDPNKKFKKKKTYLVTIGPGTDYTIDTNTLMQDVDYSKGDGMLTEEEYQKTALGRIEQITNDIQSKAGADANIEYVIDPGTDFGFSMSFGEDGKEEGATGRFVVLPNIQTNYRVNEQGEKLYSLPEYAKDISSLVGAINIPGSNLAGEKAQELTKSIFTAANYGKSSLRQAAETKRIGGSKSVHPIGISNEQIERLMLGSEEDKKRATELISSIYVSRELAKEMLSDKTRFIDKNKKYDSSVHENAINEALKYAGVDLSTLSDSTIDQKIDVLLDSITEGDGRAVKGISSIINRYPSISKHSAAFASVKIDPSMTGLQMKVGPGLMKFMNGDYDGDTVNLILGLWGSGYSIEAAAEMVERQRRINERVYKKMSAAEKAKSGDELTMISGSDVGKNADFLNLSALATKFNKPYTGLFSNISTKIREGLNASGYDYDILTNESSDTDYIKVIQGELVSVVGQILEQDSISAKKVEKRIQKRRDTLDRELTQEEKNLEQQTVLTEFENLDKMLRDPQFSFSEIIDKMKEMELFSDDVSQISSVITSVIESLTENLGDKRKESIYKRLGLNEADLEKGVLNADAIKKAGSSIEYATGMKIFGGEYGKGFATSREFTPHMKNDEYQLLKFVKSVDEANNVLKTMGELIDENGNRFSQYGEKIRGAMGVLKLEAGQEAAKTIIAGKENKAISALAVSYGGLASEVEGLKEIGASKGWNTVTGFASQLAPFGRMGTDAGYGNISSRLDRIFANQDDSDEFISMSQEERARRFGYGDDVESFEKERSTVLSSIYGTAAHSISQILSEASQRYDEDMVDLHSLVKVGDIDFISKYLDAIEIQRKKMGILGFSDDEIQKQQFKTMYSGERNFESLLNLVGGEKGKRFVNLGKPEQSIVGENALGEKLYGQIDATYISKYLDQSGAEKSIFNVVDYKNLSGEIKPENVIQVLTYIALLRQLKAEVQKMKSEGMSESDAIDEIVRKNTDASGKQKYSKEFIQNILSSDDFAGKLISTSKGVTTQYSIKDPGTALMSKILSGNLSDEDLKTLMSFVTKNVSTTSQLQATEKYKEVIGEEATAEETKKKEEAAEQEAQEKSLKSDYVKLLKEQYDLLIKIDAIEEKMRRAKERGERTTGFEEDLNILQRAERSISQQMHSDKFADFADDEDIQNAEDVQRHRRESKKATLGLGGAEEQLAYFEKYAERRIGLEAKIEDATIKAQTAQTTNARKAFENLKTIYEGHLSDTDEVFEKLKAIVEKEFPEQFKEITERMKEQRALLFAQKAASNRGNRTIFDVIKSDIQHATMRITDFGLAARGLNAARKEIQQVYQNILKLNEAMTNLRVITGTGQAQAMEMMRTYNSLAKELGTTTQAVAQSAAEWLRQGYSVSETNKLIQSSTYLSRLGFMDMSQSVTALTSVMKGFRVEASNSMEIVDKLTQLDAKYATTAGDIATALSRTSAVAREAGLDLDQTAAALTTMIDISQQDASSVGNAFKTILARYGNVKAGVFSKMMGDSEDIDETNSAINDTEKVLNAIGIQVRSSSNDIRDFDEVFAELAEKYQYLSDVERAAVTTALGGVRQRNLLNILLNNYDQYIDAIEESQKAVGSAERKNQAYLKSTAYQISRMSAAWEDFTQKLDADEGVVEFFKLMSNLIEKIDRILPMVLTYVASIRAYKLPQLMPKLLGFMGFTTNEEGKTDVKGGFSRWGQFFTGQASGAQEQQSRKTLIFTIRDAIKAIRNNTAAKMGTKPPFGPSSGGSGRATGMTLSGKKVYQDSNGVWRYLNHRVVGDKDLQGIQTPSSKKEMSAEDQARLRRSQNIARTVATGVTAGVSIGLSTEGDTTDKVTKGLIGGVLGAGAGALNFVPYAGPILSTIATLLVPVLTDLIGDNLLKIIKQNEVARADRIKIANEQLEALNKITISTSEIMSLSKGDRGLWDADDWKTYNDYIDSIESTKKASVAFADALEEAGVTLGEYTQENLRTIEATRIRVEADQKYAAGEEERYKLLKEIEENRKKLEGDEAETARSLIAAAQAEIEEFKKERQEGYLKAAFITSGVGSMSAANINAAALERVIMNIAEVWANDYPELFEEGYLTNDARSEIISFLREQPGYESLLNQTTRDVFELNSARDIVETAIKGTTLEGKSISELQKLVKEKGWTTLREIFGENYNLTDFVDKLSSVDDDAISMIAHSLGMTVEEFHTANKQGAFDWLTKGDAINGAEKLADKMNALDDIIVDLAADGALTAENINKIVQNYKFLLRAPDGSIGIENVLGNLATQLATGADSPMMRAYVGRRIKELSEDQDVWALYTSSKKFEDRFKTDDEKYNNLLVAGSYSNALNILGDDDDAKQDFWNIASELAGIPDLFKQTQEKLIEFKVQEYDNEIQNLASIKDALADINKQREREIDLIKAKESLENAQKEFKSVYRAGIGWTYEVDQAAVESAQERVDELERQQTQEDLQYQIDILNQQKELLENISKNEELQNLQEIAKNFAGQVTANDLLAAILGINVTELRDKAEAGIRDEAAGRVDDSTKEANYKAFESAKGDYEKALQTLKDYYENNEAILEDTANPLYGTTKDEYARLYADAQTKRAAVLEASEATNAGYGAEMINRPDPNKYAEAPVGPVNVGVSTGTFGAWLNPNSMEKAEGASLAKHMVGENRSKYDNYVIYSYDPQTKTWSLVQLANGTTLEDAQAQMSDYDILINNWHHGDWNDRAVFKVGNQLYWVNANQGDIGHFNGESFVEGRQEDVKYAPDPETEEWTLYRKDQTGKWVQYYDDDGMATNASGTLSFAGGRTLINENGLESIITPQGTITSLPAKSGILPVDLTKNLWTLGEVAPNLIARLSGNNLQTTNSTSAIDNSISINKLDATFHTTQDFDGHQFITDLKNQVLLTANNH